MSAAAAPPAAASVPRQLSTADLPVFFADRHVSLADELLAMAPAFADPEDERPGGAARVAARLGARGLYAHLAPDPDPAAVDVRALCLVREMLGYVSPLADAIFAVQGLGTHPIAVAGQDALVRELLPDLRSGRAIAGFALTEPEAGSDVASLRTTATRDGDRFHLSGDKTFISNAGIATHYIVFANADPDAGRRGITAFVVDAGAPGLEVEPMALNINHPIGALHLRDVAVAPSARLGADGEGFSLAMRTLERFRVSVGAAAVGMARRALDAALAHTHARRQFGRRLIEQQLVIAALAEMATELDAARLLVWRAALAVDGGGAAMTGAEVGMAKLYATEAAQRIVDRAVQLHGGRGVTAGEPVEALYRQIRPLRIYEGTSEIQKLIIGRALTRGR